MLFCCGVRAGVTIIAGILAMPPRIGHEGLGWFRYVLGSEMLARCRHCLASIPPTFVAGCKGASLVIGTGIGGLLAQPAVNYPSTFSEEGLFGR